MVEILRLRYDMSATPGQVVQPFRPFYTAHMAYAAFYLVRIRHVVVDVDCYQQRVDDGPELIGLPRTNCATRRMMLQVVVLSRCHLRSLSRC
ncbi:hypothetical protein ACLKA6_008283 [Drosophila palustris]